MSDSSVTVDRTVTIGSSHGLHARPAKLFTQLVVASGDAVTIAKEGGSAVNAASILSVIAQGINHGDTVTVTVTGDTASETLEAVTEFLATDHDSE